MRLPPRLASLREYHDAIIAALASADVPVYLDTSMIMWLVKVGREARKEFLDWCSKTIDKRTFVPTWAAHEFYRHLRKETLLIDMQSESSEYQGVLSAMLMDVALRANSLFCDGIRYRDNSEFVKKAREAIVELHEQLELMRKTKSWYTEAVDEMTNFVNGHITSTNAFDLLEEIQATHAARFEGRVPPGFQDEAKQANSIGDLVFWQEIIAHVKTRSGSKGIVILTNDNKPDWHHKPKAFLNYDGKEMSTDPLVGAELKIPHPLLAHEINCQAGITDVFIINPSILSVVLARTIRSEVKSLVAAIHPRALKKDQTGINWAKIGPKSMKGFDQSDGEMVEPTSGAAATTVTDVAIGIAEELEKISPDGFKDAGLPEPEFDADLVKLQLGMPERAEALTSVLDPVRLEALNVEQVVLLGRRIFRSATTSGEPALSVIPECLGDKTPTDKANALLLGMFIELYFDQDFKLRNTPLAGPFEVLFDFQTDPRFEATIKKVAALLKKHEGSLLVLPSTEPKEIDLVISLEPPLEGEIKELNSVVCDGKELLCDVKAGDAASLTVKLGSNKSTVLDLLRLISKQFTLPLRQTRTVFENGTEITWSELKGICELRTDFGGVADPIQIAFGKG